MVKRFIFSAILIILFGFIAIISPGKIDATYDSDECINQNGWLWVGPEYWGDPCGKEWQTGNYCCNSGSSTTSYPQGNNVCNDKHRCTVSNEGWCTHGPYASQSEVKHDCTWGSGTTCGICYAGDTQIETQTLLSCTSNPSACSGYAGRCDQYVTVQERTRTCASDCGSWGSWSGWSTTNEYSQCPTDGSIDCGNCTVPPTCGNGACDNGETCSSCWTDCGVCPATAKYKCSGSSCIRDDTGGTTTNPSCGGLCGVSSGCPSVSLSVSPNPVNTNSPVTFTATSTHAYTNANVSTGGGTQGGDDFSVTGSYTWKWVYDPPNTWGNSSATAGTYNATFSGDRPGGGSACTTSTSYTVNAVGSINGFKVRVDPGPEGDRGDSFGTYPYTAYIKPLNVWIDNGAQQNGSGSFNFPVVPVGAHTIHLDLPESGANNWVIKYTSCLNSTSCHTEANFQNPTISGTQATATVNVPSGGDVVDFWWHFIAKPKGFLNNASCTSFSGWACDPDDYTFPTIIHIYKDDGPGTPRTYVDATTASVNLGDSGVSASCGGNIARNFVYQLPPNSSLRDNILHRIYANALNYRDLPINGIYYNVELPLAGGGNNSITCAIPINAWIQTIGGDVHSNVSIDMGGN